jgi:plastocyanin
MMKRAFHFLIPYVSLFGSLIWAQGITFTTRVERAKQSTNSSAAGVAVWLVPIGDTPVVPQAQNATHLRLIQKNKMFQPHVLVVPVGSVVEFPNRDPFFHNVFSLFEGKRFDLGLYEAGTTREVHFNRSGVSYIFCNIHPEMSGVIIAIPTPYYAISDSQGEIIIPNVNAGRYTLHLWYEGIPPDKLNTETRDITISERNSTLGPLQLPAVGSVEAHKNKYGSDYDPPTPSAPGYDQR